MQAGIFMTLMAITPEIIDRVEEFTSAESGEDKLKIAVDATLTAVTAANLLPGVQVDKIVPVARKVINLLVSVNNRGKWSKGAPVRRASSATVVE